MPIPYERPSKKKKKRKITPAPLVVSDAEGLRVRQFGPTSSRLQAPIIVETADRGPRAGPTVTPQQAQVRGETARFMRERGPIGQRTAGVYTPWQKRERKKRRKARRELAEQERAGYQDAFARTRDVLAPPPPRRAPPPEERVQPAKRELEETLRLWAGQAGFGKKSAPQKKGFLSTAVDFLGGLDDFLAPGGGLDERTRSIIGAATEGLTGRITTGGPGIIPVRIATGDEYKRLREQRARGEDTGLLSLPARAAEQIMQSLLYTPAFAVDLVRDPGGAAKGVVEAAKYAVENPMERPGDVIMLALGARGLIPRSVPRAIVRSLPEGPRAALEAVPRLRENVGFPGKEGREQQRIRRVESLFASAEPLSLRLLAKQNLIDKPGQRTPRKQRSLVLEAQSEAIRHVMDNVTAEEMIAVYETAKAETSPLALRRMGRLNRLIDANRLIIERGLLQGDPHSGGVKINPKYDRLRQAADRVIRQSRGTEETKLTLGLISQEQAALRRALVGRIASGAIDVQLLRKYKSVTDKLTKLTEKVESARDLHARLLEEQAVLDELLRSTAATPESLALKPGGRIPLTLQAIKRQREDIASLSKQYERKAKSFEPQQEAIQRLAAIREQPWAQKAQQILEQQSAIPRRGLVGGDERPIGPAFATLKSEGPTVRSILPLALRRKLGIPRRPVEKRATGAAIRTGRVGNIIKLTADEELRMLRYQQRLRAWEDALAASMTGREMLAALDRGALKEGDVRAVRVKAGTTKAATNEFMTKFFMKTDTYGESIFDIVSRKLDIDDLMQLADEADRTGQIRFFDNSKIGLEELRFSSAMNFMRFVNQAGVALLLYTKGPGYVLPQLPGLALMAFIHQGVSLPASIARARVLFRELRNYPEVRVKLRAMGGRGITAALNPEGGPVAALRAINAKLADFYGRLIDDFWRETAVVYEARKLGYKTADDLKRLTERMVERGTKEYEDALKINDAVENAYGAFNRMTEFERKWIRDFVLFYPWIRASARYTLRLPIDHPVKAAALAMGGTQSREKARANLIQMFVEYGLGRVEAESMADELMRMVPGIFAVGDKVISPQSAALFQSPFDIAEFAGEARSEPVQAALRFGSTPFVNIVGGMVGYDIFRGGEYPEDQGFADRVYGEVSGLFPYATLVNRLAGDQGVLFTYTPAEAVAQTFLGTTSPRGLNLPGAVKATSRRLEEDLTPAQRASRRVYKVREQWRKAAIAAGYLKPGQSQPVALRRAFTRLAERRAQSAAVLDKLGDAARDENGSYTVDALRALTELDLRLLRKWGILDQVSYRSALAWARKADEEALRKARDSAGRREFSLAYGKVLTDSRRALLAAGQEIPEAM